MPFFPSPSDLFYLLYVTMMELVIVTTAQYILFKTWRLDKSFAVLSVIQLTHSTILSKNYFEYDSLGYTEMVMTTSTFLWYGMWAINCKLAHDKIEKILLKVLSILNSFFTKLVIRIFVKEPSTESLIKKFKAEGYSLRKELTDTVYKKGASVRWLLKNPQGEDLPVHVPEEYNEFQVWEYIIENYVTYGDGKDVSKEK